MYPHERSLVERLNGKPFVLIGVNSDPRDGAKQAINREDITWRSFWDGGSTSGPIAAHWNIEAWPTTYVLDHEGVIRARNLSKLALDRLVDQLIAELQ